MKINQAIEAAHAHIFKSVKDFEITSARQIKFDWWVIDATGSNDREFTCIVQLVTHLSNVVGITPQHNLDDDELVEYALRKLRA